MSRLGYLETQGSTKRLRMVQPGYDADDPATPPNKVIFDSNDLGTLSIITTGVFRSPAGSRGRIVEQIATWPDPGFVPLVAIQLQLQGQTVQNTMQVSGAVGDYMKMTVSRTGLSFDWPTTRSYYIDVFYTAFMLAAA